MGTRTFSSTASNRTATVILRARASASRPSASCRSSTAPCVTPVSRDGSLRDLPHVPDCRETLQRMNILHTIDSAGMYGAEAVLLNLAEEQLRRGHRPIVFSIGPRGHGEKAVETEAARRALECVSHRMTGGLNLRGAAGIVRLAEQLHVDVIHSHG